MYHKILAVAIVPLLFLACSKSITEKKIEMAIESGTGKSANVKISSDGIDIKTSDGSLKISGGGSASLPENFPSDVYVDKDAAIVSSAVVEGGTSVTFRSGSSLNDVLSIYKKEMAGKGWALTTSMNLGDKQMAVFNKGDRVLTMMLDRSEKDTMIALTIAKQ